MHIGMTMVLMSTCKYSPVTHQLSSLEPIYSKAAACMRIRQGMRITMARHALPLPDGSPHDRGHGDHLWNVIEAKFAMLSGPDVNGVRHRALEVPCLPVLLSSKASTFSLEQRLPAMLQLPAYMHFCSANILHLTNLRTRHKSPGFTIA
jgi:hypothetical protein